MCRREAVVEYDFGITLYRLSNFSHACHPNPLLPSNFFDTFFGISLMNAHFD